MLSILILNNVATKQNSKTKLIQQISMALFTSDNIWWLYPMIVVSCWRENRQKINPFKDSHRNNCTLKWNQLKFRRRWCFRKSVRNKTNQFGIKIFSEKWYNNISTVFVFIERCVVEYELKETREKFCITSLVLT